MDSDPSDDLINFINFTASVSTIAFAERSARQPQPTSGYFLSVTEIEGRFCSEGPGC